MEITQLEQLEHQIHQLLVCLKQLKQENKQLYHQELSFRNRYNLAHQTQKQVCEKLKLLISKLKIIEKTL